MAWMELPPRSEAFVAHAIGPHLGIHVTYDAGRFYVVDARNPDSDGSVPIVGSFLTMARAKRAAEKRFAGGAA